MKFFLLSLSFLVCSITIPNLLKAQDGFLISDQKEKEKISEQNVQPEAPNTLEGLRIFGQGDPPHVDAKILKQMEHERLISEQFLELLAENSTDNLISLEANLVDLKGQGVASYDRLMDEDGDSLPKECILFYQVLLQEFIPKAESMLDAAWSGETGFEDENFEEDFQKLKNCQERVAMHLAQL